MTSTLFPFQTEALDKLRSFCKKAKRDYKDDGEHTIITLAAPTGAGKTIIMSGLMEKILRGDENNAKEEKSIHLVVLKSSKKIRLIKRYWRMARYIS